MFRFQSGLVGKSIHKDWITTMWYCVKNGIFKERYLNNEGQSVMCASKEINRLPKLTGRAAQT